VPQLGHLPKRQRWKDGLVMRLKTKLLLLLLLWLLLLFTLSAGRWLMEYRTESPSAVSGTSGSAISDDACGNTTAPISCRKDVSVRRRRRITIIIIIIRWLMEYRTESPSAVSGTSGSAISDDACGNTTAPISCRTTIRETLRQESLSSVVIIIITIIIIIIIYRLGPQRTSPVTSGSESMMARQPARKPSSAASSGPSRRQHDASPSSQSCTPPAQPRNGPTVSTRHLTAHPSRSHPPLGHHHATPLPPCPLISSRLAPASLHLIPPFPPRLTFLSIAITARSSCRWAGMVYT
jgi:hypothetical protein